MKYYRPQIELTGKRLSASTIASFMAAQSIDEPDRIQAGVKMPSRLLRFLMRERAVSYWASSTNRWIKTDPFNEYFVLTEAGIKKVQDRLAGRAKAQSVTREAVLQEFDVILGNTRTESVDIFEFISKSEKPQINSYVIEPEKLPTSASTETPKKLDCLWPDELPQAQSYLEGLAQQVLVNRYERSVEARCACIKHYGSICQVCKFDFKKRYGVIGAEFIHVHHVVPVSSVGAEYQVDPVIDLVPVCPNCHAMLHRRSPPLTVEELQNLLRDD